jgi:hypothetical protein
MSSSSRREWAATIQPMAVGMVMVFLFVWLFGAALHDPSPHEIPMAIVAPVAVAEQIVSGVEAKAPGAFAFESLDSEDAARAAIEARDVDGAVLVGGGTPRILVAGAAGAATSSAISGAFTSLAAALGQTAEVEDVHPFPESDSRGLVPFFLALGVSVSAFIFSMLTRTWRREGRQPGLRSEALGLLVFAVLDGLVAALATAIVVGFDASYWTVAGVCALLALAVAAGTTALCRLFGSAGIGVAGIFIILLGNASSGSVVGRDFLPQPFRWLSAGLPSSSGLDSIRAALYFEHRGVGAGLSTLAIWIACSLAILAIVTLATRARSQSSTAR